MKEKFFPLQIIDNFFRYPDKVVKKASSLKFNNESEFLHKKDEKFFNETITKMLCLSFDLKSCSLNWENVHSYFKKIKSNKQEITNYSKIEYPLVAVIFLTKKPKIKSNITFYKKEKNKFTESVIINNNYNRLVLFDGNDFHKINIDSDKKEELVLIFKLHKIMSSSFFPLQRMESREI